MPANHLNKDPINDLIAGFNALWFWQKWFFPRELKIAIRNHMLDQSQDPSPIYSAFNNTWFLQRWFFTCLRNFSNQQITLLPLIVPDFSSLREIHYRPIQIERLHFEPLHKVRRNIEINFNLPRINPFEIIGGLTPQVDQFQTMIIPQNLQSFFRQYPNPNYQWREHTSRWWNETGRQYQPGPNELTLQDIEMNAKKLEMFPDLIINQDFLCGISNEIMTDPVYARDCPQQKFELHVITRWLREKQTHPCTRAPLHVEDLVHDVELKARIDEFVDETMSGGIRATPVREW